MIIPPTIFRKFYFMQVVDVVCDCGQPNCVAPPPIGVRGVIYDDPGVENPKSVFVDFGTQHPNHTEDCGCVFEFDSRCVTVTLESESSESVPIDSCEKCGHPSHFHGKLGHGACRHGSGSPLELAVKTAKDSVLANDDPEVRSRKVRETFASAPKPCKCRRFKKSD